MRKQQKNELVLYTTAVLLIVFGISIIYERPEAEHIQVVSQNVVQEENNVMADDKSSILTEQEQLQKEEDVIEIAGLSSFLNSFYEGYTMAINDKDKGHISAYIGEENKQQIVDEFETWFIANKDVVESELAIKIEKVQFISYNMARLVVLEEVMLENREEEIKKYKIITKWSMDIELKDGQHKINKRELTESIVALEKEGEWTEY